METTNRKPITEYETNTSKLVAALTSLENKLTAERNKFETLLEHINTLLPETSEYDRTLEYLIREWDNPENLTRRLCWVLDCSATKPVLKLMIHREMYDQWKWDDLAEPQWGKMIASRNALPYALDYFTQTILTAYNEIDS